ncbi:MAG: DivIVA domain-containing protein [Clostridiales bacterium]|nr:DivIVA domain-containing protein [Candidatus Equinaster intestinalis]
MMTSNDVREVSFAKSVSGYNREEVDDFLDKVEADYKNYEAYVQSLKEQLATLTKDAEQYKASSESLQTVLVSAQQLADKIIEDAKQKAAAIEKQAQDGANEATAEAKEMLANFDQKLAAKRALAEQQMASEIEKSKKEQDGIKLVTDEIIRKQQASFDRLKIEIAQFKKNVIGQYKEQLELISKLPDDIVMDA